MTATVLRFPQGRVLGVRLERERGEPGWLVIIGNRRHGWLYGDRSSAVLAAHRLAARLGVAVLQTTNRESNA